AIESHNLNGRVERVIRTIREGIYKAKGETLEIKIRNTTNAYNRTWHFAINMTPEEAIDDNGQELESANSKYSAYAKKFKEKSKVKFKIGQKVIICIRENFSGMQVNEKVGRFNEKGVIINVNRYDSYLVKLIVSGKLVKKIYYDIKEFDWGETT
ncbi:hypothetical protein COBT_003689, partial [Conglomerata obtusa]